LGLILDRQWYFERSLDKVLPMCSSFPHSKERVEGVAGQGTTEGSAEHTMGHTAQIEGTATVALSRDPQRLHPLNDSPDACLRAEGLRAKLIAATVEIVAEGASNPSLNESRVVRTPA
jgi:hypothetical protein